MSGRPTRSARRSLRAVLSPAGRGGALLCSGASARDQRGSSVALRLATSTMAPKWMSSGGRLSSASPLASHSVRPSVVAGHCRAKCRAAPWAGHPGGRRGDEANGRSSAKRRATG
eukprot:9503838-Pyramimonas_sp.AAC.2